MDRVQCSECDGKVYQWKVTDSPIGEHMRLFPNCQFVQKLVWEEESQNAGSACIQHNQNTSPLSPTRMYWVEDVRAAMKHIQLFPHEDIDLAILRLQDIGTWEPSLEHVVDEIYDIEEERREGVLDTKTAQMMIENMELKAMRMCRVCKKRDSDRLLFPCQHMVCCQECVVTCKHCPVCGRFVVSYMQVYRA